MSHSSEGTIRECAQYLLDNPNQECLIYSVSKRTQIQKMEKIFGYIKDHDTMAFYSPLLGMILLSNGSCVCVKNAS